MGSASNVLFIVTLLLSWGWISSLHGQNDHQGKSLADMRVITYNVWYGFTKVPERKSIWLQWMQDQAPDVVSLQELNGYTPDRLQADAATWEHPYTALLKEDGFPTGITSRYPIEELKRFRDGFHHGAIRARIQGIYFYVIHLHPSNWQVRHHEIDALLKDMSGLKQDAKIILAGDFNTLSHADSAFYRHGRLEPFFAARDKAYAEHNLNAGKLDYQVTHKVSAAHLIDSEHYLRKADYRFTGTFPTQIEKEGEHGDQRRLDYIYISKNLKDKLTKAVIISDHTTQRLSDHLPVCVDLQLE
ncbi:MAG: hypothetical protein HKN87_02755 [Saprospiraceae bacterium]|nr:hypothetical protein [Saprospiraceae bacterium]